MPDATLFMSRMEFIGSAAQLKKFATRSKLRNSDVVLDFDVDRASLSFAGSRNWITAKCSGRGSVAISGLALETLALTAQQFATSEIEVRIGDGMLRLGRQAVSCEWLQEASSSLLLPINASLSDILALRYNHTREQIEAAGLTPTLAEAEEERDRAIARVAHILAPFGVPAADLREFVIAKIRESIAPHENPQKAH